MTTWATQCTLQYGDTDDDGWSDSINKQEALCNHRMVLRNLRAGTRYRFRVRAPLPNGGETVVEGNPFTAKFRESRRSRAIRQQVELRMMFPEGLPSEPFPVTSRVPLPPGALGSTAQVRLVSQEGREIATDVRPMSWWNDGSLRWILLDFADSPEQKTVTLEFGP